MFAGGWMWRDTHTRIPNARHWVMDEPLCHIGGSIDEISEKISEEINKIPSRVTLVGNSLGGFICLNLARLVPAKVKNVIISGTPGFGKAIMPFTSIHDPRCMAKEALQLISYDKAKITPEYEERTIKCFTQFFRNILRLMRESNAASIEQVLADVHCPVHAIWGGNDVITPYTQISEILERFGISSRIIRECGHTPMCEKPEEFASELSHYMRLSVDLLDA